MLTVVTIEIILDNLNEHLDGRSLEQGDFPLAGIAEKLPIVYHSAPPGFLREVLKCDAISTIVRCL